MEPGAAAAKVRKPTLILSFLDMPAASQMACMTARIMNARGKGCGISSERMTVSAKMEMTREFQLRTNLRLNQ